MKVKWYGTAAISVTAADETILFDPFISFNDSNRFLSLDEIADCKHVFITHGHFDHLMHIPAVLDAGPATVYCDGIAAETLRKKGVSAQRIVIIKPGDAIKLGSFTVKALKGEHIVFDNRLILKTLFNRRIFQWAKILGKVINGFLKYPKGQVLIYDIKAEGQQILHMGSLGMCPDEKYPRGADVLTIPFQGRSDLNDFTLQFVERINPRAVFLHHFDDTFPPISSEVDTSIFANKMADQFPEITVIRPDYLIDYSI